MKVLVTGAGGFIGPYLVPALAEEGHEVFAVTRSQQTYDSDLVTPLTIDLSVPLAARSLPAVDCVVHMAQANVPFPEHATELYRINAVATQELLDHARRTGASRFVLTSSGSVYGFGQRPFDESDPPVAHDFYALTKIHAEQLVVGYRDFLDTVVFRFFMPYGPGQRGRLLPALIDRVRRGDPIVLNGGGQPRSNPIFVADVIRALVQSVETEGHHTVNVAGDEVVGIRELGGLIGQALGVEPTFAEGSPDGPGDLVADTSRLHELFHLRPLVPLTEGLRRTAATATEVVS